MRVVIALIPLLFSFRLFALGEIAVDDPVPNFCWDDSTGSQKCLYDEKKKVRVLIYTSGYCQACTEALPKIVEKSAAYKDKPILFFNLVSAGDKVGDPPSQEYLESWQKKFSVPFTVAASPADSGTPFYFQAEPPVIAVVDEDKTLDYKANKIDIDELFKQIDKALAP